MNEEWKDVLGLEGFYEVSNLGRVRSRSRIRINKFGQKMTLVGRIRKLNPSNGYLSITLWVNCVPRRRSVHRLVGEAFIPNPLNLPEINHVDGVKTRNLATNLEWSTESHNIRHSFEKLGRIPLHGVKHGNAKLNDESVKLIRIGEETMTHAELARRFNVSRRLIGMVCRRRIWTRIL